MSIVGPMLHFSGWNGSLFALMFTRPGKHTKSYGKSLFLMGKSTISMVISIAILNYQRVKGNPQN